MPAASTPFNPALFGASGGSGVRIIMGRSRGGRGHVDRTKPSEAAVKSHDEMMPIWVKQLQPEDNTTDYARIPTPLLRELYPYVYFWGVRADILLANLQRMNDLRAVELNRFQRLPGYQYHLQPGSFTEDLLLTYHATYLAGILLREDVAQLLPYLKLLHDANLFQVAYRNVSTAEVHEENLVVLEEGSTPLHDYYRSELSHYRPRAWLGEDDEENVVTEQISIEVVQSVFVRICLGEPIMHATAELAADWQKHVAFCERWELTP